MSHRSLAAVFALIAVVALSASPVVAQTAPRMPWGQPDLQGVWDFRTITPLQRPEAFADQEFLTAEEAANLEQETIDRNEDLLSRPARRTEVTESVDRGEEGAPGFYNNFWLDQGTRTIGTRRTSLIVDPPDGRIPAVRPKVEARRELQRILRGRRAYGPEDRGASERCLLGFNSGPPMTPGGYNQNVQLFQTADHVVLLNEMVHNARIIPLDGRSHLPAHLRQWVGDSRASWEDDTLVVETRNFLGETSFRGSSANLQLVERFTRVDADTLLYEFTVMDPTTWARPWTAQLPMTRTDEPLYEYACHEGNYSMESTLSGARAQDKAAALAETEDSR